MKFLESIANAVEDVVQGVGEIFEQARERKRDQARAIAEPYGLGVDDQARIVGTLHDVPVIRYTKDHGGSDSTDYWTHTEYQLQAPLPAFMVTRTRNLLDRLSEALGTKDIQLGVSDLDPGLWIRAPKRLENAVRSLLTRPDVIPPLRSLVQEEIRIGLQEQKLHLMFRGHHLKTGDRGLAAGALLANALDRAIEAPWLALEAESTLTYDRSTACIEGHYRGVAIRVQTVRPPGEALRTLVTAWFDPPLPPGTEVRHHKHLKSGEALDDAILDKMLRAVSSDISEVRRRLCVDDARGPLLEVLHGFPTSRLLSDQVVLRMPGYVGIDLRDKVDLVVDLVCAVTR